MRAVGLLQSLLSVVSIACSSHAPGTPTPGRTSTENVTARAPVPATAPDTQPAWIYDDTSIVSAPRRALNPFVKNLVVVLFRLGATQAQRQAAIDAVEGTVIGGVRLNPADGLYLVSLPSDSTHARLFQAIATLKKHPSVSGAMPDYIFTSFRGERQERRDTSVGAQMPAPRWPLLTDRFPDLDTSRVVTAPPDTFRFYRTDITISFKPDVSDSAKALFFKRHSMRVLGVTRVGRFFVRIPDPGPTVEDLFKAVEALRRESEVARAGSIPRSQLREN